MSEREQFDPGATEGDDTYRKMWAGVDRERRLARARELAALFKARTAWMLPDE